MLQLELIDSSQRDSLEQQSTSYHLHARDYLPAVYRRERLVGKDEGEILGELLLVLARVLAESAVYDASLALLELWESVGKRQRLERTVAREGGARKA